MTPCASYHVTAVVSCYNASGLLRGCLEDLLGQTLYRQNQLEIIVVDSGSSENEHEIVTAYQARYPHIRLLRTERETVYAAWNRGIQAARGRYVTNANTDDAHRADALEILSQALEAHPQADLGYANCAFTRRPNDAFPGSGRFLDCRLPAFTPALGMFYCLLGPHPVWRKSVFDKIGWFDPNFCNAGDYEFQMRFIQAGLQAVWVPEILSLFYQNPNGLSLSTNRTQVESKTIETRYRATAPISRLYAIDPGEAVAVADAWVSQGNLALSWMCAWQRKPLTDLPYARRCYSRALDIIPGYLPALQNMAACMAAEGNWESCRRWVLSHPHLTGLQNAVAARAAIPIVPVRAEPSVSRMVYRPKVGCVPPPSAASQAEAFQNPLAGYEGRSRLGRTLAHIYAALAALNAGDREAVYRELNRGMAYCDGDEPVLLAIGILMLAIGRTETLQTILDRTTWESVAAEKIDALRRLGEEHSRSDPAASLPRGWLDEALQIFRGLEYRALGLPEDAAPHLLAGSKAAESQNLDGTLRGYRIALQKSGKHPLFGLPLRDKVAFLEAKMGALPSVAPPPIQIDAPNGRVRTDVSRLCRQEEFATPEYAQLCRELGIPDDHYERKNWEYFFVAQALKEEGLLQAGRIGLGFGVGREKLVAYFARKGCTLLATDVTPERAAKKGWVQTNQHSDGLQDLFLPEICDFDTFQKNTRFEYVDMNRIPDKLKKSQFDFTWSCCVFEHLGSIEKGMRFILDQMHCLRPGGIALHTTEFNLSSDVATADHGHTVIFRKKDIEEMATHLRADGHHIVTDYRVGNGLLDRYVDIPPYLSAPDKRHLRLLLGQYVTTSVGLAIRKAG